MKALILAAGRGRRLWPFTAESPKCLLDVGGMSLLERQLYHLRTADIRQVAVVCGFGIDRVRATLKQTADQEVKLLYNPFYAVSDNLISLWVARSEMNEDFILLNGDNIFHPHSVRTLTKERAACYRASSTQTDLSSRRYENPPVRRKRVSYRQGIGLRGSRCRIAWHAPFPQQRRADSA